MSARKGSRKKQLAGLRTKHPEVAAQLAADAKARKARKAKSSTEKPQERDTSLFVDGEYSHREAIVEMRCGPHHNQVGVKAEIVVCDNEDDKKYDTVLVHWRVQRTHYIDDKLTSDESEHGDDSFHLDEVEAWATAVYKAVQLGKAQGYLPNIGAAK